MITTETPTEDGTYLFCGLTSRSGGWQDMQSRLHPQLIRVVSHDGMRLYALGGEYIDPKRLVGAWKRVDVDNELLVEGTAIVRVRTARSVFRRALRDRPPMSRREVLGRVQVYAMTTNLQQNMVSGLLDLAVERGFVVESEDAGGGKLYAWGKP